MKYAEKFIELLKQKVGNKVITNESSLKELGIDSLDLVEIILSAEEEFGITFSNEELNSFKTVNDVVKVLDKKQN